MTRWTWASIGAAVAVYLAVWIGWTQNWAWLASFDSWSLDVFGRAASTPNGLFAWDLFCTVFGPAVLRMCALGAIVVLLVRRHLHAALFVLLTVELSGLVTEAAKRIADRPRPATAMVYAYGTSFPSGHALGIMVIVLTALTLVLPMVAAGWRAWVITAGVLLILGIGLARVVLNVHHLSDVIAGWALGYVYFVLCCRIFRPDETPVARDTTP